MLNWLKNFPRRLYDAFLRFPASFVCTIALFIILDLHEHAELFDENVFFRLVFVLILGIVMFAAAQLVTESFGAKKRHFRIIAGAVVYLMLQGYYFIAVGDNDRGTVQFLMLLAAACLFAVTSLNLKNGAGFEKNASLILVRIAASVFFSSVFFVGLVATLGGIDLLLAEVESEWYIEAVQVCYIIFLPAMFFIGVPQKDNNSEYPKPLKALFSYVILPIIIVFTAVLYIYYIKLIITRSLPISETGGVSLAFLAVCIPSLILITPLENKLSVTLRKIIPFVLVPVVIVLFVAAGRQILLFGITVTRYLVIAGGIAALVCIFLIRIKSGKHQRIACLVIAAVCIASAIGPQSAYNLASESQAKRLEGYLTKNNMLKDNNIIPNPDIPDEDKKEIVGLIQYIQYNDLDKPAYFPENIADLNDVLGFDPQTSIYKHYRSEINYIGVSGYDYVLEENTGGGFVIGENVKIERLSKDGITIKQDEKNICDIQMKDIAAQIYEKIDKDKELQDASALEYSYENDYIKLKYLFKSIAFNNNEYNYGSYTVLLKIK